MGLPEILSPLAEMLEGSVEGLRARCAGLPVEIAWYEARTTFRSGDKICLDGGVDCFFAGAEYARRAVVLEVTVSLDGERVFLESLELAWSDPSDVEVEVAGLPVELTKRRVQIVRAFLPGLLQAFSDAVIRGDWDGSSRALEVDWGDASGG